FFHSDTGSHESFEVSRAALPPFLQGGSASYSSVPLLFLIVQQIYYFINSISVLCKKQIILL
ncbi:hypothetical protein NE644_23605, partial [Blautia wexlerae]|uniref:hypothetical protein n=1 Tax=Blautia wexlerae TaxID=418240 RepID=UPI00210E5424